MELLTMNNSTITDKWKLCTISSFFCFFVFAFILTSNRLRVDELFVGRSSTDVIASSNPVGLTTTTPSPFSSSSSIDQPVDQITDRPSSSTTNTTDVTNFRDVEPNQSNSTYSNESEEPITLINSTKSKASVVTLSPPPPPLVIREVFTASSPLSPSPASNSTKNSESISDAVPAATVGRKSEQKSCNIFEGKWVYNPSYSPVYGTDCPFQSVATNCRRNGRPDSEYQGWIWQPNDCDIPLFNGRDMLERLRGKRVILVGDSINHNQWQSLACLIYNSISPSERRRRSVKISSTRYLKLEDYDFTLEFHQSPFLVHLEEKHPSGRRVLHLDKIDPSSNLWRGADVMVFNSAHWWNHGPDIRVWDVYEHKGQLIDNMTKEVAYGHALATWSNWVAKKVNPNKTAVFFRSDSPQHGGKLWCFNATKPVPDDAFMPYYPRSMVEVAEKSMVSLIRRFPVKYLNITWLSGYRRDGHPGLYVQPESKWKTMMVNEALTLEKVAKRKADCSHWCLPGLPDTWNRLLYASLFFVR